MTARNEAGATAAQEPPRAVARARYVRVAPMKARRVVELIRGRSAREALAVLEFAPTRTFKGHVKDDRRARRR